MPFWIKPQTFFFFFFLLASNGIISKMSYKRGKQGPSYLHSSENFFSLKRIDFNWWSQSPNSGTYAPLPWILCFNQRRDFTFSLLLPPDTSGCWCKIIATWQWLLRAVLPSFKSQGHQLNVTKVLFQCSHPASLYKHILLKSLWHFSFFIHLAVYEAWATANSLTQPTSASPWML